MLVACHTLASLSDHADLRSGGLDVLSATLRKTRRDGALAFVGGAAGEGDAQLRQRQPAGHRSHEHPWVAARRPGGARRSRGLDAGGLQ